MGFIRARLVGFSALVVGIHLAVSGLAISAACDPRDEHHGAAAPHECQMPAEQAHACPMHHASSPTPPDQGPPAPSLPNLLRCNCGGSFSFDGLLGTPFVLGSAPLAVGALVSVGAIATFVPATLDEPTQVSSPPPRS